MSTFTRDNPIWATALWLVGFLAWTVPLWVAAIWVLFKREPTILSWLASHGVGVNAVTAVLFAALFIGTIVVLAAFARTVNVVTELGPWQFDPSSVHVDIGRVDFRRLAENYAEPHLSFEIVVANGSGRPITLTGITGTMACDGEPCLSPPILDQTVNMTFGARSGVFFRQAVTAALAQQILTKLLRDPGEAVLFDFGTVRFTGMVKKLPVSIFLEPARFHFKGPFSLENIDTANVQPLHKTFLSGVHYDQFGMPRR